MRRGSGATRVVVAAGMFAVLAGISACGGSTSEATNSTAPIATDADAVDTTTGAADADLDLAFFEPLVAAVAGNATAGASELTLAATVQLSPRADLDGYFSSDGFVIAGSPSGAGCAWLAGGADGTVLLGESADPACSSDGAAPSFSADGAGAVWAPDALALIDRVARDTADIVLLKSKTAILVDGSAPSPDALALMFPGLSFVAPDQPSTRAFEVSLGIDGSRVTIAVLGQSGTCYQVDGEITSQAVIRFGTGASCTAADAPAAATEPSWPE